MGPGDSDILPRRLSWGMEQDCPVRDDGCGSGPDSGANSNVLADDDRRVNRTEWDGSGTNRNDGNCDLNGHADDDWASHAGAGDPR